MMRPTILLLALGVALAGDATTSGIAQRASAAEPVRAAWSEVKWPFPLDQWGLGRAFRCPAADCGTDIALYVRAKLGFCNCATGVSDDMELDRVGDLELLSDKFNGMRAARRITVVWRKTRSRTHGAGHRFQRQVRRGGRDRRRRRRSGCRACRFGFPQRRPGSALGREGARALVRWI